MRKVVRRVPVKDNQQQTRPVRYSTNDSSSTSSLSHFKEEVEKEFGSASKKLVESSIKLAQDPKVVQAIMESPEFHSIRTTLPSSVLIPLNIGLSSDDERVSVIEETPNTSATSSESNSTSSVSTATETSPTAVLTRAPIILEPEPRQPKSPAQANLCTNCSKVIEEHEDKEEEDRVEICMGTAGDPPRNVLYEHRFTILVSIVFISVLGMSLRKTETEGTKQSVLSSVVSSVWKCLRNALQVATL